MKKSVNMAVLAFALLSSSYLGKEVKKVQSQRAPASIVATAGILAYIHRDDIKQKFEEIQIRAVEIFNSMKEKNQKELSQNEAPTKVDTPEELASVVDEKIEKSESDLQKLYEEQKIISDAQTQRADELAKAIDKIASEKEELQNLKSDLEVMISEIKNSNDEMKKQIEEKDKEISDLKCIADKNKSLEEEIKKLITENEKVAQKVEELEIAKEEKREEKQEDKKVAKKDSKESDKKKEKQHEDPSALAMIFAQMMAMQQQQQAAQYAQPFSNVVGINSPFQQTDNMFNQMMMLSMQKQMFESIMNKNSYGWTDMYQSPWGGFKQQGMNTFPQGYAGLRQYSIIEDTYGIDPYMGSLPYPGVSSIGGAFNFGGSPMDMAGF